MEESISTKTIIYEFSKIEGIFHALAHRNNEKCFDIVWNAYMRNKPCELSQCNYGITHEEFCDSFIASNKDGKKWLKYLNENAFWKLYTYARTNMLQTILSHNDYLINKEIDLARRSDLRAFYLNLFHADLEFEYNDNEREYRIIKMLEILGLVDADILEWTLGVEGYHLHKIVFKHFHDKGFKFNGRSFYNSIKIEYDYIIKKIDIRNDIDFMMSFGYFPKFEWLNKMILRSIKNIELTDYFKLLKQNIYIK